MVTTIIRRKPVRVIKKAQRRELINVAKTGISNIDVVNQAIDDIITKSQTSGSGTATSSTTVPRLLKKRREVEQQG